MLNEDIELLGVFFERDDWSNVGRAVVWGREISGAEVVRRVPDVLVVEEVPFSVAVGMHERQQYLGLFEPIPVVGDRQKLLVLEDVDYYPVIHTDCEVLGVPDDRLGSVLWAAILGDVVEYFTSRVLGDQLVDREEPSSRDDYVPNDDVGAVSDLVIEPNGCFLAEVYLGFGRSRGFWLVTVVTVRWWSSALAPPPALTKPVVTPVCLAHRLL